MLANEQTAATRAQWETTLEKAEQAYLDGDQPLSDELSQAALKSAVDETTRATVLNQLGVIQMKEKRFRDAEKSFAQALALRKKSQADNALVLQTLSNYALATYKLGDEKKAEELYMQCIESKRKLLPESPSLANTLTNLAHLYSDERRCAQAKALYEEALAIDSKSYGLNHEEVANDLFNIGALLERCNDFNAALTYLNRANDSYAAIKDRYGCVKSLHYIALCHAALKNYDEAAATSLKSLALHEELNGKGDPETLVHLLNAGKAYAAAGHPQKAEQLYKQALACASASPKASNWHLAQCNLDLAQFYRKQGESETAEQYFKKALVHYEQLSKKEQRALYELPLAYSQLLHDLKRTAESDKLAHKYLPVYAPTP